MKCTVQPTKYVYDFVVYLFWLHHQFLVSHWNENVATVNFDEIFITCFTGNCHFDNFQYNQGWKFNKNYNISISVFMWLIYPYLSRFLRWHWGNCLSASEINLNNMDKNTWYFTTEKHDKIWNVCIPFSTDPSNWSHKKINTTAICISFSR